MKVHLSLKNIQSELKCAKTLYNKFGGYYYRSAEAILESLKPLLAAHSCIITINDSIELVGDRFYVKAVATLTNIEDGSSISTSAYAREDLSKKGQDASQVTGSTSSYARKYALNGLFCIDDTKDSDATNNGGKQSEKKETDENPIFDMACNDVRSAKTTEALKSIWNEYSSLQSNQVFKALVNKRKAELNGAA